MKIKWFGNLQTSCLLHLTLIGFCSCFINNQQNPKRIRDFAVLKSTNNHFSERFYQALPKNDKLDNLIVSTAVPSAANLAVVPLVGAVDTYWIGRLNDALALAGQGAANQCFFSVYFLIAFLHFSTS